MLPRATTGGPIRSARHVRQSRLRQYQLSRREIYETTRVRAAVCLVRRAVRAGPCARAERGVEGFGRASPRLPDGRGGPADGQEAGEGHQRPHFDPDVPADAVGRREGNDRAGTGGRAADRAHLGGRHGPGGGRAQRVQPAFHLPRRSAHAEGDRRPDRPGAAGEGHGEPAVAAGGAGLDGRRDPQRLLEQAGGEARGSQGPEDPDDGQPAVRRDHERDGRQRRRDGLQRAVRRAADGRGRRRREQSADAPRPEPLHRQQGVQPHRPPDHSRDLRVLAAHVGRHVEGRPGPAEEALARGPARAARAVGCLRRRGRDQAQGGRRQVRAVPTRRRSTRRRSRSATSTAPSTPRC